jgi:hypothetical protein
MAFNETNLLNNVISTVSLQIIGDIFILSGLDANDSSRVNVPAYWDFTPVASLSKSAKNLDGRTLPRRTIQRAALPFCE